MDIEPELWIWHRSLDIDEMQFTSAMTYNFVSDKNANLEKVNDEKMLLLPQYKHILLSRSVRSSQTIIHLCPLFMHCMLQ